MFCSFSTSCRTWTSTGQFNRCWPSPKTASWAIVSTRDCIYRRLAPKTYEGGAIRPGAELVRFYVKKTGAEPRIEVQPRFAFKPAIRERFPLEEWLHWTARTILELLREFGKPPPSAERMLDAAVAPLQDVPPAEKG
jgi:hypothetical protein